jgi:glycosyltransferase involved in cell wall biosynthesis
MKRCDVYVQPSRHEGYCTTITEAFVLGKVIVASDVSGVREQLIDGETGIILQETTPECLAQNLCGIISDKALYENISRNVIKKKRDFSTEMNKLLRLCSE